MNGTTFQSDVRRPPPVPIAAPAWRDAAAGALRKFAPQRLVRRPVMAVVATGALLAALVTLAGLAPAGFGWAVTAIALLTVLLGNFAEALAESRGRGLAASLRRARQGLVARRLDDARGFVPGLRGREQQVPAADLRPGDLVVVSAGEMIPADGEIGFGLATINEAAATGESAPVLREAGTDRAGVIGGTKVLTDEIIVRVAAEPGHGFQDRMVALAASANRQKTTNEIALARLLVALMLAALLVCASFFAIGDFVGVAADPLLLIALLLCLIPTTIGGLLPSIGVAGVNRALAANVLAKSGTAVETAGEVDVLLLDTTGSITHGDRQVTAFHALAGIDVMRLREAALLASLADPTAEGKSIVRRAHEQGAAMLDPVDAQYVQFSAQTRMSGVDLDGGTCVIRIGTMDAIARHVQALGGNAPVELLGRVEQAARSGVTSLVVSEGRHVLGVVELSNVVRHGIREQLARLRDMGIRSVMVTGDDPLTAAAIAAEAGVDDYVAQARPEDKLARVRAEQAAGHRVAMVGHRADDAPALAQADVGMAMNSGSQAAREAGNMVDLDSDPAKLLAMLEIGRQQLVTRAALTSFSLASDLSRYLVILPVLFAAAAASIGTGSMAALNVMDLSSPRNAVLAALIYNASTIAALIPLALRGLRVRPARAAVLLRRKVLLYGVVGALLPFAAIKLIDLVLVAIVGV